MRFSQHDYGGTFINMTILTIKMNFKERRLCGASWMKRFGEGII